MKMALSSRLWQLIKSESLLDCGESDRVGMLIPLIQVQPSPKLAYSQIIVLALATCDVQPATSFITSVSARVNSSVGFAYLLVCPRLQ